MTVLFLILGFVLLLVGGELLVRGAVAVATRLGVSPLLIGLTLVGFGTSTPELLTSLDAALSGAPGIAIGNVVGSNIANVLLILGIAAVLQSLECDPAAFKRDGAVLVAATLAGAVTVLADGLTRWTGLGFLAVLLVYVVVTYRVEKARHDAAALVHEHEAAAVAGWPKGLAMSIAVAVLGIALTLAGARFLVDGAVALARGLGVGESVIGLTVVALGTSLPELATTIVAAVRRQADVAFGNVVGSNIFNILGILGTTAVVRPFAVPADLAASDVGVMLAATGLLVVFAITGWRLTRGEGLVFLAGYAAYIAWLAAQTAA